MSEPPRLDRRHDLTHAAPKSRRHSRNCIRSRVGSPSFYLCGERRQEIINSIRIELERDDRLGQSGWGFSQLVLLPSPSP